MAEVNETNFVELNGVQGKRMLAKLEETTPRLHRYLCEVLGDDLYKDETISLKTRLLCVISAITAQGGLENPLKFYLKTARKHGVTKAEVVAVIETVAVYAGTPKAIGALFAVKEIFVD